MKRRLITIILLSVAMTLSTVSPIYAEGIDVSAETEAEGVLAPDAAEQAAEAEEIEQAEEVEPGEESETIESIDGEIVGEEEPANEEEADTEETVIGDEEKIPFNQDTVYISIMGRYLDYTGKEIRPKVKVNKTTDGYGSLIENEDYTVEYQDNIEPGKATIILTGIGAYEGVITRNFTILSEDDYIIDDEHFTAHMDVPQFYYMGRPLTPPVYVLSNDFSYGFARELYVGDDFEVSYYNNDKIGTATAVITGIGRYSGTISTTFDIVKSPWGIILYKEYTEVKTASPSYEYTGMERRPNPIVTFDDGAGKKKLVRDVDYTVSYENNKEIGTGKIIVTGIGDYSGEVSTTFEITPVDLNIKGATAKTKSASYPCTGKERKPVPVVKCTVGNKVLTLENGKDFTVFYRNNINAGTATVIVVGIGKFQGTITTTFKLYNVNELNSTNTTVKTRSASYEYTGYARKPAPVVTYKDGKTTKTLVKDTDYTVAYKNNTNAGTATVTVTGIGKYKGTVSSTFKLTPVKLTAANATAKTCHATYTYTGKERRPVPVVKCKVGTKTYTLEKDKDFTVTYANNKEVGTGTVTVKGIGNYAGTIKATFKIIK